MLVNVGVMVGVLVTVWVNVEVGGVPVVVGVAVPTGALSQ